MKSGLVSVAMVTNTGSMYKAVLNGYLCNKLFILRQNKSMKECLPPFILSHLTCRLTVLTTAVQSVVDPCNIAVYLHTKNPYLHSISRTSCNKTIYSR